MKLKKYFTKFKKKLHVFINKIKYPKLVWCWQNRPKNEYIQSFYWHI